MKFELVPNNDSSITRNFYYVPFILLLLIVAVLSQSSVILPDNIPIENKKLGFKIISETNHDKNSFTQGLMLHDNLLYESAGLYGKSTLRLIDPSSGNVLKQVKIPDKYFAEGITIVGDLIYMLTWKERKLLIFDRSTFTFIREIDFHSYNGEGWGITYDGDNFIVSDGSPFLTVFQVPSDKDSKLTQVKTIKVIDPSSGGEVRNINELEYVDGFVYANIWYRDKIIKIDPSNGHIVAEINLYDLYPVRSQNADCLNGIAYDKKADNFILTGKLWPKMFSVKFL